MTDLSDLTLEEKAALTSGADAWHTKAVPGVNPIMVADGPHGLRKQAAAEDEFGHSVPATCFPPAVGLGSSWDIELAEQVGAAIGREALIEEVAVVLGPGINIKRSPLCGRNFEYFSEDPIISGALGAALVRGIQSQGVGGCVKHFAANNQETDRARVSADIDPRPLREIYLRGFQRVIRDAQPWTVMCSYNRINGVYASEDPWLLTTVLREEWGYAGLVMSDWGAVNDRVAGVLAGLDLEMPSCDGRTDAQLVAAVRDGSLPESALDQVAGRVIDLVRKAEAGAASVGALDIDAHHRLAREAAARCLVLLKNDDAVLPLAPSASIAVIGEFAQTPRYQGAGSSQINPTRLDSALQAITAAAPGVTFARGFTLDGTGDAAALRAEAVAGATAAETAVVFLGVPAGEESEGYDRAHMDLPADQLDLVDAVLAANPRTVVVLSHGAAVLLPFADRVPAILDGCLLGQAGGTATAEVLFGAVNPSGRLTETLPLRLEDTPAYATFPGEHGHARYGEGLLVGYRWYDALGLDVAFPFGHGLSYTTFSYGTPVARVRADGDVVVTVEVTNTGPVAGREVVQIYTSLPGSSVQRAPRELKGFAVVAVEPGQTQTAEIVLLREELAYWDTRVDRWIVEGGRYLIEIGASSRDLRAGVELILDGDPVELPITLDTSLNELIVHPVAGPLLTARLPEGIVESMMWTLMGSFPISRVVDFPLPRADLFALIKQAGGRLAPDAG